MSEGKSSGVLSRTWKRFRSAVTGQWVRPSDAETNPNTTYGQDVPRHRKDAR